MILAVCGKPIVHSASPVLHRLGCKELGKKGSSLRIICDSAEEALSLCRSLSVSGLNVTAPFKEEICKKLDVVSEEARKISAVNTVVFDQGKTSGYNTDIYGVEQSLRNAVDKLSGLKAVVLGAGGAAKAACQALRQLEVVFAIVNRSADRADEVSELFGVDYCLFSDEKHKDLIRNADIVVNCLSTPELPFSAELLNPKMLLLDSHYKKESELSLAFKACGAKTIDGYEWLINQSRKSQEYFLGKLPQLQEAKQELLQPDSRTTIALVGLMGSGKSQVARLLADRLGLACLDLDAEVEKQIGSSIASYFKHNGEASFRAVETEVLARVVSGPRHVLACGGGVVLSETNRRLLSENCKVIWLWASPGVLKERLKHDSTRPILQGTDLLTKLKELIEHRKQAYAGVTDLVIDTDKRSLEQISKRLYEEIH